MPSLSFDNLDNHVPLYVKCNNDEYKIASTAQVLARARYVVDSIFTPGMSCNQPEIVKGFLSNKLAGLEHEVCAILFLDNQLRLIKYKEMFSGSISQASVYPREIAKTALRLNAKAIIMAHNHPSGDAVPSDSDINLTKHMKAALGLLDILLMDHVLIAGTNAVSFAERGLI